MCHQDSKIFAKVRHRIDELETPTSYTIHQGKLGMNTCDKLLSEACSRDDLDMVYFFVTQRYANIDNVDLHGITPLAWAAKFNNIRIMEYLLGLNAKVDLRSSVCSRTPLQVACAYGNRNIEAVALLLKHGASLTLTCESEMKEMRGTALDQAINCYYESNRLVKMLQAYLEYHSKHSYNKQGRIQSP